MKLKKIFSIIINCGNVSDQMVGRRKRVDCSADKSEYDISRRDDDRLPSIHTVLSDTLQPYYVRARTLTGRVNRNRMKE